ncbi:glycoside hydrolase family 5 protein [Jaapia argillacea MUCL 33604]|uniref:mannan endo-1,4-beta-mannosidase n=1 Tax=Jaapia argillacea MUCL 33604 TaxID=933084 RepID=A0A067Q1G1_9AGAM|nr:glycoside hydrolase family 5 protein [Jaapia argillacea MUCL 33604]
MRLSWCITLAASFLLASATKPSRTRVKRDNSQFVTTANGQFQVQGRDFKFVGTNAYWLSSLQNDQDIANTFANISALGIKVVRTWFFNDVDTIPTDGSNWFQLINNSGGTINTGPNGLQRLDKIVQLAEAAGIYILPVLTNNWNPRPTEDGTPARRAAPGSDNNNNFPRNYLSNDYGGMDVYVRQLGDKTHHDIFYSTDALVTAFKNYITAVVSRYVNSPAILGWEIANDPRCFSTLSASGLCTPQTITQWHSTIAEHILSVDPNHLVASGSQGFYCAGCPKLFPRTTPPPPQVSPPPGTKKRNSAPLTKAQLIRERIETRKRERKAKKSAGELVESGPKIRGRWSSTPAKRQAQNTVGPAYDGSQGVDSEDILNIPSIGFGTFQLFPDQDVYTTETGSTSFDTILQTGLSWIEQQAETGRTFGKPTILTAFGLVSQTNAPFFVPFNSTVAPFANSPARKRQQSGFVTDSQLGDAYTQWFNIGLQDGINGLVQYQYGSGGLSVEASTPITGTDPNTNVTPQTPNSGQTGQSPNDGYYQSGYGADSLQSVLGNVVQPSS